MSNLNVLLVDDHSVVRMGFKMLIDSEKDMQVIAEAETGEDGIIKFQEIKQDVIVMDITMPGIGGLEAIERIIAKDKNAKILVLSAHEDSVHPKSFKCRRNRLFDKKECCRRADKCNQNCGEWKKIHRIFRSSTVSDYPIIWRK
jgi:CheY-like chemotaxis protein